MFKACIVLVIMAICVQVSFFVADEHVSIVGLFGAILSYGLIGFDN